MFLIRAREIHAWLWDQCRQSSDEVPKSKNMGLKEHMSRAILIRRLELITHVAIGGERQPSLRHCRSADIATQSFQLLSPSALAATPHAH